MYNNNRNNNNLTTKTFTIVDFPNDGQTYGKFKSTIAKKAANEAFMNLLKYINFNKNNENDFFGKFVVFVIKDIDSQKMYKYIGTVVKLKKPVIKTLKNGNEVTHNYKIVIGKYNPKLNLI